MAATANNAPSQPPEPAQGAWWHRPAWSLYVTLFVALVLYVLNTYGGWWSAAVIIAGSGTTFLMLTAYQIWAAPPNPDMEAVFRDMDALSELGHKVAASRGLSCPDCGADLRIEAEPLARTDEAASCPACGARFTIEGARAFWGYDAEGNYTGPPRLECRGKATFPSMSDGAGDGMNTEQWMQKIASDPKLKSQTEAAREAIYREPPDAAGDTTKT